MKIYLFFIPLITLLAQSNRQMDSLALVALYNTTDGNNWNSNSNWLSNSALETWYGVETNADRVIRIDLRSNNLNGTLPEELSSLDQLEILYLRNNNLSGPFPLQVLSMQNLYYLHLGLNQFSGTIPQVLSNLQNLVSIYLYENNFDRMESLEGLEQLNYLNVYGNHLNFSDIIRNQNVAAFAYGYNPQKNFGEDEYIFADESANFTKQTAYFNHPENQYRWTLNGNPLNDQNAQNLNLTNLNLNQSGYYQLVVTNPLVADLELNTSISEITIVKSGGPAPPNAIKLSSEDNSITIDWNESTENNFRNYNIYAGLNKNSKTKIDSIFVKNQTTYTILNLNASEKWFIELTTVDQSLKESNRSLEHTIYTQLNGSDIGELLNLNLTDHRGFQGQNYNDIWGFSELGNDYIMISRHFGFELYRIGSNGKAELILIEDSENNDDSLWGELRYFQGYIYKSTETDSIRIFSINLTDSSSNYIGKFHGTAHNITLSGKLLFTAGGVSSGVACYDLSDPDNPQFKWLYDQFYVHDLSVQNDTIYLAELNNSSFAVYDISNVIGPDLNENYLILRHKYANGFTHNIWPSPDGSYVVTTDEHDQFDHLQLWDIRDKNNVLNRMKFQDGKESIVHNAFIKNDYLFVSYYSHGMLVFDISDKELPVKISQYDSYTPDDLPGYDGNWGVYAFLNSNYIALSNSDDGLDIVEFDYTLRAGNMTIQLVDSVNQAVDDNYTVEVSNSDVVRFISYPDHIKIRATPNVDFSITVAIENRNYSKTITQKLTSNQDLTLDFDVTNKDDIHSFPEQFKLFQNYPNPFNPSTTIQYDLANDGNVQVSIYNMLGQKVRTLLNQFQLAGSAKKIVWDGKNDAGQQVVSGIYIYQLNTSQFSQSRKMILLK